MAGKGDKPRNCFSEKFRKNYDDIFGKRTTIKNKIVEESTKPNKHKDNESKD